MVQNRTGVKVIRQGYGMSCTSHCRIGWCAYAWNLWSSGWYRAWPRKSRPKSNRWIEFQRKEYYVRLCWEWASISATIDSDGWLHTGDVGQYDENGEWFIVSRIKELIKYNAFQVPPAEIQAVLLTHPQIKDVECVDVPDEKYDCFCREATGSTNHGKWCCCIYYW